MVTNEFKMNLQFAIPKVKYLMDVLVTFWLHFGHILVKRRDKQKRKLGPNFAK
jgi:hypothetical protein